MIGLLLVRFDPLFGPSIFLKAPTSLDDDLIKDIPSIHQEHDSLQVNQANKNSQNLR